MPRQGFDDTAIAYNVGNQTGKQHLGIVSVQAFRVMGYVDQRSWTRANVSN